LATPCKLSIKHPVHDPAIAIDLLLQFLALVAHDLNPAVRQDNMNNRTLFGNVQK
jgi:hypothetical protein